MSFLKKTLLTTILCATSSIFSSSLSASELTLSNSTWKYNNQSAYALQHDDYCGGTQDSINEIVVPALLERNLTASFGIIPSSCWGGLWETAAQHVESGFTLFNHSMRHTPAYKPSWEPDNFKVLWDNKRDISDANKRIKDKTGYSPDFMALPYDVGSDESYEYVRDHLELIAMRAPVENNGKWTGNLGINHKNFYNPYQLKVEVFHNWSPYWKLPEEQRLPKFLQDTIKKGGFGIQYFHGVDDDSYYAVSKSEYLHFLDVLKKARDEKLVWVSDAGQIVKYRFAREYCTLVLNEQSDNTAQFKIEGLLTKTQRCTEINRQLTAIGQIEQQVKKIQQGGESLGFTHIDGQLQFEYETDKGDIKLHFKA